MKYIIPMYSVADRTDIAICIKHLPLRLRYPSKGRKCQYLCLIKKDQTIFENPNNE